MSTMSWSVADLAVPRLITYVRSNGRVVHGRSAQEYATLVAFDDDIHFRAQFYIKHSIVERTQVYLADRGRRWIEGHHDLDSPEVHALIATWVLSR